MSAAAAKRVPEAALSGVGLGLRWPLLPSVLEDAPTGLSWLEVAPENYVRRGGRFAHALAQAAERYPLVTHGFSLSLGGRDPLDLAHLRDLRAVIERVGAPWHSDHLCFSGDAGVFAHELFPLPHTAWMARHVAERVKRVQDALGVPMAVENVSSYGRHRADEMSEAEFVSEVVRLADCGLLLDVNNVYVNSQNHGFDPQTMIASLPLHKVVQLHVAGHERRDALCIDTHAAPIVNEVYTLLEWTLGRTGPVPVLLDRDDHFDDWNGIRQEICTLHGMWLRVFGGAP